LEVLEIIRNIVFSKSLEEGDITWYNVCDHFPGRMGKEAFLSTLKFLIENKFGDMIEFVNYNRKEERVYLRKLKHLGG